MKVSEKMSFQEYWEDDRFSLKKPVRNGSRVQMLGDNIYHVDNAGEWIQEDSHHSNPDGSTNIFNLERDTSRSNNVLISNLFLYFGSAALDIDLDSIEYRKIRNYKKNSLIDCKKARKLVQMTIARNRHRVNIVINDPCQFMHSHVRVDQEFGKLAQ